MNPVCPLSDNSWLEQKLPVDDIDPVAEFPTHLLEMRHPAKAETLMQRDTCRVGQSDAANGSVKTAFAKIGEQRLVEF